MSIHQQLGKAFIAAAACLSLMFQAIPGLAVDTDIYQPNVKHNAYILLDNSGSMAWGVYENSIDYSKMYDSLEAAIDVEDGESLTFPTGIERNKIYLIKCNDIGVSFIGDEDNPLIYHGDTGNPKREWVLNDVIDLHTYLDAGGNLVAEGSETTQRLTLNDDGYVLLDGKNLPLSQNRKLHDFKTLFDGSTIDEGFGGLINAPGYYCSGLEGVGVGSHDEVEDNDDAAYFFVSGNWLNMQHVLNLEFVGTNTPVWPYRGFDVSTDEWSVIDLDNEKGEGDYPAGDDSYAPNLKANDTKYTITHPGAQKIQVHFSMFDVDDKPVMVWNKKKKIWVTVEEPDYVRIYDSTNKLVAAYNNSNNPQGEWSTTVSGDTVHVVLTSNSNADVGKGYTIDQYRVTYSTDGTYRIQSRLDVAKAALLYVIDEMWSKINWGFARFNYTDKSGNGATILSALNPNLNDDTNREDIKNQVRNVDPLYGTPLGEALQDIFEQGYYKKQHELDNLNCRKNYVITVSDGFPSDDDEWDRIGGVVFSDSDKDGFTADPSQYENPDPNYYDDVARWMYEHSWIDKTLLTDPGKSFFNVISHQISFGAVHPLMQDAAEEAGGKYITAYNKSQMVSAFYSLALMISEAISFTAPVVSVDAANKVQNGDDLYMGQFLPMDAVVWPGNLKKYKLGDGSTERPDLWMIYDAANNEAIDSSGRFVDNTDGFWGDENDENDSDAYGASDIHEDGVGEVLTERVANNFTEGNSGGNYYARNIKTYLDDSVTTLSNFDRSIDPTRFGLDAADTDTRNKIVNWVYGYTFAANATTGDPVALRGWALGAIVHSRPTVIDYYKDADYSQIEKRYVVAGADDGMLHVFDDADGSEILAFVPPDLFSRVKGYETVLHQPLVDGPIKLYRENGQPKYLIFGLRRGGSSYWALDVRDTDAANWTLAWSFTPSDDSEMGQSWSDVEIARIRTEDNVFTNVAIFSGGYDPVEDNFPEPFNDLDNNGTPYKDNVTLDSQEWDKNDANQDIYDDDKYTLQNPSGDSRGRAIYVLNADNGEPVFTVKYGASNVPATPGVASDEPTQTRTDFIYCFPASPSVISQNLYYSYKNAESEDVAGRMSNVLAVIYAPDIYGNLFRITYDYAGGSKKWQVSHLFSANPGSSKKSGLDTLPTGFSPTDTGRKVFYGPAVSWRGSGRFFDLTNYYFSNTIFTGTDAIASLFFGTGDREHPSYQMVQDRVYALYDDMPVWAHTSSFVVPVNSAFYTEENLLNITCDELGEDTLLAGKTLDETYAYKTRLQTLLTDDVLTSSYLLEPTPGLEDGENDAKGWYIILEKQGLDDYCSLCAYAEPVEDEVGGRDYHVGEKILGKFTLYAGVLYFTSYQPSYDDPCNPQGNAFTYALNYLDGRAALNLNSTNDDTSVEDSVRKDVTDRYGKYKNVKGLPSGFQIIVRNGKANAFANIGERILKPDDPDDYGNDEEEEEEEEEKKEEKKDDGLEGEGLKLYYWIER